MGRFTAILLLLLLLSGCAAGADRMDGAGRRAECCADRLSRKQTAGSAAPRSASAAERQRAAPRGG